MKYFLMNKDEVKKDIWINPILIKTKSFAKIIKYRNMLKQIEKLKKDIISELKSTNTVISDEKIDMILSQDGTEISSSDFNKIYAVPLYDRQEQRISAYSKTEVLKGKLIGNEIILTKP